MAAMLVGSSTTHTRRWLRVGLEQYTQGSTSVMLLQTEQRRRLALTSRTAVASKSASSSLERRMWKARRCALLLPIPGSFFNSSMSRVIGSANLDIGLICELSDWVIFSGILMRSTYLDRKSTR